MATLFLMCGLPGSGKTTLAKAIERERCALRLTPDDWIEALHLDPYDEATRARIEKQLWNVAAFALEHGVDVVLDFGVWQRRERDEYRERARALGARTELRFLDASIDELTRRLEARNIAPPTGSFRVDVAELASYADAFERPTDDEIESMRTG
jgi:predicted kinase